MRETIEEAAAALKHEFEIYFESIKKGGSKG